MAGPWITPEVLLPQIKARLALAQSNATPEQWNVMLSGVPGAITSGWLRLQNMLGNKGFPIALMDTWNGRANYNARYAIAYAFRQGAFASQFDQSAIDKELESLDKELEALDALFDDNGNRIYIDTGFAGAVTGRLTSYDCDLKHVRRW